MRNRDLARLLPHNWQAPVASTIAVTFVTVPVAVVA